MIKRLLLSGGLVLAIGALVLGISNARNQSSSAQPELTTARGKVETRSYPRGYRAVVYTPAGLNRSRPAPMVVMLHGCGTTAEQMEAATELDQQADRDHFVVMYPDASDQRGRCWRFGTDYTRSSGDPAGIERMVRDALGRRATAIDPDRVYLTGMSSGAAMTAVLGATHPDLFAAIAINAGCAYRANHCGGHTPSRASDELAREALDAMEEHSRVVPVLVMQGDKDNVVPGHSQQVLDQWRMTDNLIASGTLDGPIPQTPARTREKSPHGRYRSTVEQYDAAPGCRVLERWTIHGMGHFWPGGTKNPKYAPFTDPRGPDGGDVIWSFFRRFDKAGKPDSCVPRTP